MRDHLNQPPIDAIALAIGGSEFEQAGTHHGALVFQSDGVALAGDLESGEAAQQRRGQAEQNQRQDQPDTGQMPAHPRTARRNRFGRRRKDTLNAHNTPQPERP